MDTTRIVYITGLILAVFYIFMGLDDFIWDLVSFYKKKKKSQDKLYICELAGVETKLIAMMIGAWQEANVLEEVIDNIIMTQVYPKSMYHIFIGTYPNDQATIDVVKKLEKKYGNVHCVINQQLGPTSKSQNLNHVIKEIKNFENIHNCKFSSFTVHDSEDIVHPYELRVTNYLINNHAAIQFPVFPIIEKPKWNNFFKYITTNTYADEFAENHFITMVNRHKMGAFVPSAGTGFSLKREIVEEMGASIFPENSLTEDYRLSLTLYENGIQMYYVLESIQRVDEFGKIGWEFIATRSIFPNTYREAVKQKTRWILGITMQSYTMKDILKKDMPFVGRYSLYKDQKAKIGNLLFGVGYPVLIYFIISLFIPLTPIYPRYSLSWYLCLLVTIMMIERQVFRSIALYVIYGLKMVFFGVLLPPFIPIRIVWGNIINFVATIRAYKQMKQNIRDEKGNNNNDIYNQIKKNIIMNFKILKTERNLSNNKTDKLLKIQWDKTNHEFVNKEYLKTYQRLLGDILVAKNYLTTEELRYALIHKDKDLKLGQYLLNKNIISEAELIESLAIVNQDLYVEEQSLKFYGIYELSQRLQKIDYQKYATVPILQHNGENVLIYSNRSPKDLLDKVLETYGEYYRMILVPHQTIEKAINIIETKTLRSKEKLGISWKFNIEQIILIRNEVARKNSDKYITIRKMGLINK